MTPPHITATAARRGGASVAGILAVGLLAAPAYAGGAPADLVLRATGDKHVILAGADISTNPVAALIGRVGPPTSRSRGGQGLACTYRWVALGLTALAANLGGKDPCTNQGGRIQTVTLTGRRWRTARGLEVGGSLARLRALYPGARRVDGTWRLVGAFSPIGEGGSYTLIGAITRNGRVTALTARPQAAGD